MSGVSVITGNLKKHPECPHGPTLLFSRKTESGIRNFFACAACRDRKDCSFFVWQDELPKMVQKKKDKWDKEKKNFLKNINHRKLFITFNEVSSSPLSQRKFCATCSRFEFDKYIEKHEEHKLVRNITDYQLSHPLEILPCLEDAKKEAQYLFSKNSVVAIVNILKNLDFKNVICIGTPKLHEYISNECDNMNSLLLDIDDRFHNFFGPMEFCWYNMFNNHFFFKDAKEVFEQFLQNDKGEKLAMIMDPPFGGRVEPLAQTVSEINKEYKSLNKTKTDLPVFWIFPYFMEPQITNSLPDFKMLDYKVDYINHPLFQKGPKGRKQGTPVRIFTNIIPSRIVLPQEEGYKYCKICEKWVSAENKHCKQCKSCTSKDGRTYKHCDVCKRCVKPTWSHCEDCGRCGQAEHKCGEIAFTKACFHCKKEGHKKSECPDLKQNISKKRKKNSNLKHKKKKPKNA